jgi:hypothetical protein
LASLFPVPRIWAVLVGKGVRAQAPSNNKKSTNNNTNKRKSRTQSSNFFVTFNIKQQKGFFSKIKLQRKKENVMYVNDGCVMAAMSI